MKYTHTRNELGRLRATCDRCGESKCGPERSVARWQREHATTCLPLTTRPATAAS